MKTFSAARVRARRCELGLTVEAVAVRIGRSDAAYRSYEQGWRTPSVPGLAELADALRCPIDALFDGEPSDWPPPIADEHAAVVLA